MKKCCTFFPRCITLFLKWPCSTRLLPLAQCQKQGVQNMSCQVGALKQWIWECVQGIPKKYYSSGHLMIDCRIVPNVWSPTECRTKTVIIHVWAHGHGMYLPLLIKFFHCALKCPVLVNSITRWSIITGATGRR